MSVLQRKPTARGRAMLQCEVCGVRCAGAGIYIEALLIQAARRQVRKRAPRWPHRDRAAVECPECGGKVVVATWLSRDGLELR